MKQLIVFFMFAFFVGSFGIAKVAISQEPDIVGSFFGDPVSRGNYYFVLNTVLSFNSPWGGIPNNREQLEKRVWDDLILSYEAHRRQISVTRKEVEAKISETLKGDQVSFNWKENPQEYGQWARQTLGGSIEFFENQMLHLIQIKKLYEQVRNNINPLVTEEEAFGEFLNEHNSLSVELAEFDELPAAQIFYEKVKKDPALWEQKSKEDSKSPPEDRFFRRPGFVALEFLMEMWQFPKNAVFDMIEMEVGDIYPPKPIYEGYGVFKILDIRRADESVFAQRKESYFEQIKVKKKYQGFGAWLKDLRKKADVQVYIEAPSGLFP